MKNLPAERYLLTSLIKHEPARKLIGNISEELFTNNENLIIFQLFKHMLSENLSITTDTFLEYCKLKASEINLSQLHKDVLSNKRPEVYATWYTLLKEATITRQTMEMNTTLQNAVARGFKAEQLIETQAHHVERMLEIYNAGSNVSKKDLMKDVTERLKTPAGAKYFTGIKTIDQFGGYGNIFHLIAARYGVGKTPMGLRIALHNAEKGIPVCYWSGENSNQELSIALIAMLSKIPLKKLNKGITNFTTEEKKQVREAQEKILSIPFRFLPWGQSNFLQLRSMFELEQKQYGTEIFILDQFSHIKLGQEFKKKNENLDHLGDQLFSLKQLIPGYWILLGQLKTKNVDPKPVLTDLMWATRVEQNSDLGWVLDRPEIDAKRMLKVKDELKWAIHGVSKNKNYNDDDKRNEILALEDEYDYVGKAIIDQSKGRLGYGHWTQEISFDEEALGFCDKNTPPF